jgi:alpha-glucuronidase
MGRPSFLRSTARRRALTAAGCLLFPAVRQLPAETGREAWLRYAPLSDSEKRGYDRLPTVVVRFGDSPVLRSAQQELVRGLTGMLGREARGAEALPGGDAIVLGTAAALRSAIPGFAEPKQMREDGFWLRRERGRLVVAGASERGVLYGAFALLGRIARREPVAALDDLEEPYAPVRWVDQWDNLDGTIERGYAGRSLFFDHGAVRADLTRAKEYARLLASLGITACTVNNVNADPRVLASGFLPGLARLAEVFRPWGVRLSLAVDVSSPKIVGGLATFDPLDAGVAAWWNAKADEIYREIPDFAGFAVKADSEGRVGPSAYGRTHADAANVIARALGPHGGTVFYRAFVYNHHLDWRDPKNDRAKAAYENFHPLDGRFEDNAVVQIKHGPIDFQAREPVSPLFGGLERTNQAIELQVTQEYTGQQRHVVFLAPMWAEVLGFDLHAGPGPTPVRELVSGKTFGRPLGGFVGVVNAGLDENWLAHPLAMANLYAFGRLAWNPGLSAREIAEEWTRQTFGNDPAVVAAVTRIQLESWRAYEDYTGPLGAQTLTDILGSHYGPGIESSEENGWGQWHRADRRGIGMDRSVASGTGYSGQYRPAVAQRYASPAVTPDELLLFFHHVPYTYGLHSGQTVIQHIYDAHYEGAERAAGFLAEWRSLEGHIDRERYADVLARLDYQAGHAIVWRDAVCNYFLRLSGIPDAKGRAGRFPGRVEAESMALRGYRAVDVVPRENSSGGRAVECGLPEGCTAAHRFNGPAGRYEIDVQYFDQANGESRFRVWVNDRAVAVWTAGLRLPALKIGGDASTRRRIPGVLLQSGDEVRVEGIPDGEERAPFDYLEIRPEPR